MRRDVLLALGATALVAPFTSFAQPRDKVYRIGILFSSTPASAKPQIDAFIQGLQELGYVENKNVQFEYRYAEGLFDRLPRLAAELIEQKVDLIFVNNTPPALAAKQATSTLPIVFGGVSLPVESGVVASLSRPGGNVTGTTNIGLELTGKRLQILKEAFPKTSCIAVVNSKRSPKQLAEIQHAAPILGLKVIQVEIERREHFESQIELIRKGRADALYSVESSINGQLRKLLIEFAALYRLPVIYGNRQYVEDGGLMSYGADPSAMFRSAASYVDKILKGSKPAELPVGRPTKFELSINIKTAKALGLTMPEPVLLRADKVIE